MFTVSLNQLILHEHLNVTVLDHAEGMYDQLIIQVCVHWCMDSQK